MERRIFLRNTALLTGATLLTQQSLLAALFNTSQSNIKMLRKNVGIYTERGGTIGFVLTSEGIITIDAQFPDTAKNYMAEVKKMDAHPFKYLLNTHHHADHTSGNIAFKGMVEHVAAHQNSALNQRRVAEGKNAVDKELLPDVTFTNDFKLKMGKETVRAYYYGAGHTNGDAMYHMEDANIVHMGDLMFNRRHPYIDTSAGANIKSWITVLDKAAKKFGKSPVYIFGHSLQPGAETGTVDDLRKFSDYFSRLMAFAKGEVKAGKSKEDFLKNTAIPGVTEWQGEGITRPLTAAYEEVAAGDEI